ncbi:ribosome maturation factor RimM [Legionella waltersii]|uniref:Ribosome maturation factor RimM n=1 Tax=Legionella waltersii TaxID=66969 RepID=A0A0W1A2F9_9GAMM|nr:ribosome maturation factor RimM [Legionella waltersii]KTD75508.1 16S rRNA processing protein RimM [Legionella waltersii]SNU98396.1 16S rRNA processing protein RimM [Legionella waltersii]
MTNWVVIGRFGRPHGIKGFVTVHSFTDPKDNIVRYSDWHVYLDKQWKPIKLVTMEARNNSIVVKIEGYPERESVALLTNANIAVQEEQLEELKSGEYYWFQLVGMSVINKQQDSLGKVIEIMPTGSNDVLVVQGEKRYLIPYLPEQFVLNIDSSKQVILVDWDKDF